MPGFFTHYIAGQKVLEKLPAEVAEVISERKGVYDLGLQGPDFFNYYGAPFKGDQSIYRMSMMLHERSVDEWMSLIFRYIAKQDDADKKIIVPYFLGYLVHYAVDCAINPYISYRCGFATPNCVLPERFSIYRKRFNVAIDQILLKKHMDKTPSQVKIDEMFWVTYAELLEICRMYPVNIQITYGKDISREEVIKAYQDMNRLLKTRIKPGIVKPAALVYEAASKEYTRGYFTKTQYTAFDTSIDYMNEQHIDWSLPWDTRYTYKTDVNELFDNGINRAVELLNITLDAFNGKTSNVRAIHEIGGNSFLTGIAWNAPMLMKFYDCAFKAEETALAPKIKALEEKMKDE